MKLSDTECATEAELPSVEKKNLTPPHKCHSLSLLCCQITYCLGTGLREGVES